MRDQAKRYPAIKNSSKIQAAFKATLVAILQTLYPDGMLALLRILMLALAGVILALLGAFGNFAEHATAPVGNLPAPIEESSSPEATTTAAIAKEIASSSPTKEKPAQVVASVEIPPPSVPVDPPLSPDALNEKVRAAVVNIICVVREGSSLGSISASGVLITNTGVIMTNAHVAQYFLLTEYAGKGSVECAVRTGNPAQNTYTTELLYLPPSWVSANAHKIREHDPMGNGEHDYALLRVTGSAHIGVPLPDTYPFIPLSKNEPVTGASGLVAGYPAGFLGGITIVKDLYQASAVSVIGNLYTFATNTVDLFSIGGSVVAQRGSSGGAVADQSGALLGLIVTSTDAPDTGSRDLRALPVSYIVTDFKNETGKTLSAFLAGNLTEEARSFAENTAPSLRAQLIDALSGVSN